MNPEGAGLVRGNWQTRTAHGLRDLSARTSLRTKLITAVLGLVILALVASSIATIYFLGSYLTHQHDNQLKSIFSNVYSSCMTLGAGSCALPVQGFAGGSPGYLYNVERSFGYYAGIQVSGAQLVFPSTDQPGIGGASGQQQSLPELPSGSWGGAVTPVLETRPSQSGSDTWRVAAANVPIPNDSQIANSQTSTGVLVVAVDLGDVNATIRQITVFDAAVSSAIVVVLALVGIGLVRTNLRPLEDIEETAEEIAAGHLNRRVPELDPRTEVGSLGRSLNIMLSRIESAFHAQQESEEAAHQSEERMRRFIADASHELRTPLTAIRGFAEYYRQRGGTTTEAEASEGNGEIDKLTPDDLDRIMHRVEAEASRMGLLVEDLLLLARLDQQRPLDLKPVDILALAADAVQDARILAPDRSIDLSVAPGAAFIVEGDEPRLRQVIGNLMTNALKHTPLGTPVNVRIGSGALGDGRPAVILDVADEGPGMKPEQAHRVFERFYRADAARTRVAGGSGLGLAIVASLVAAHGGTVSVQTAPGEGANFRVKLPLAAEALSAEYEYEDEDASSGL
jgi:two-component system, OmpR family, sensor kinase